MERHVAQAAMEYIRDDMTIGLGSGKAIEYLLEFISMSADLTNLKVVTNNMDTAVMAAKRGLNVTPSWMVDHLDYAFDTLNYVVKDLSGTKAEGVVVLQDKLMAEMADHFIEIVAKDNFAVVDAAAAPVLVEVVKPAYSFVVKKLIDLGADVAQGQPVISADGGYVLQAGFKGNVDLKSLNEKITAIPGVISTSVYTGNNAVALVYDADNIETVNA